MTTTMPFLPSDTVLFRMDVEATCGAFAGDSVYHPELPPCSFGKQGISLGYQLERDDYVMGSLLVCMVLLIYSINHSRFQVGQQLRDFFYAPHERSGMLVPVSFAPLVTFSAMFMLSMLGGLVVFVVAQHNYNLFLSQVSPYLLLFAYMGLFFLMLLVKRMSQGFVGWVFFTPLQRESWHQSADLVNLLQCAVIFPLSMVFLYFHLLPIYAFWALVCVVTVGKLMLAWRARTILFPHFGLTLHLFVYLCTLEIVPLLALWKILLVITEKLIVKY